MRTKRKHNLRKKRRIRSKKQNGGSSNDVTLHVLPPKQGRTKEEQTTYFDAIKAEIGKLSKNLGVSRKIYVLNRDHIYIHKVYLYLKSLSLTKNLNLPKVHLK